ncbi:Phosphoglycolate phosphatase [Pseudoruegeria aquimaris]|uniref:Phosphoglycolate phosphatase n=1 Tax=Pseudoruegeria aquimaris TaxID=393663 RepID=A0A1Y5SEM3_9RHOB|nr:HAD-IA family hydrolase [Pseudoruegeria aquimaris]SLN38234.1 Phosphoglycolate phosphatase [Pseudoruegeria aquimaris]
MDLRLAIFDVDGTLVDSQHLIVAAMQAACEGAGCAAPARQALLSGVGLSLPQLVAGLFPDQGAPVHRAIVEGYKHHYARLRQEGGEANVTPLYPGALEALNALHAEDATLLGVATGKSRRGLDFILESFDLRRHFVTRQVADDHPSKPHPSMILTALAETGVAPERAVMIGDTSFDMEMARAAGVRAIGVSWGYHDARRLERAGAEAVVDTFDALRNMLWSGN